jgi:hypothetical protein
MCQTRGQVRALDGRRPGPPEPRATPAARGEHVGCTLGVSGNHQDMSAGSKADDGPGAAGAVAMTRYRVLAPHLVSATGEN